MLTLLVNVIRAFGSYSAIPFSTAGHQETARRILAHALRAGLVRNRFKALLAEDFFTGVVDAHDVPDHFYTEQLHARRGPAGLPYSSYAACGWAMTKPLSVVKEDASFKLFFRPASAVAPIIR